MTRTDTRTEIAKYNVYLEPTHEGGTLVNGVHYRPRWDGVPRGMTGKMVSTGQGVIRYYMREHGNRHPKKGVHVSMDDDFEITTRVIE